jgi:Talin, middle domain
MTLLFYPFQAAKKWVMEKMELNKQNVGTQMAQITKNVAQVVNLTAPPAQERDHAAVDRAINTM